jgi:LysR family hca operon transcriptional activator
LTHKPLTHKPLDFRFLVKEPLIAILPCRHRLARHKSVRPEDICREDFISTAGAAPVLRKIIEDYAAKIGIKLKQTYDAETLSAGMSLVASTGGFTLVPIYVQNSLLPSVVARPLHGEIPTIDLVMGYNKSNTSPLLKKFLLRADELASYGPRAQRGSFSKAEKPQPKAVRPGR